MTKPTFSPVISWGHILTGLTMLITVTGLYFGVEAKIVGEAHARESMGAELQAQIRANTAAIQRNIDAQTKTDEWATAHKLEWATHKGAYEAGHK